MDANELLFWMSARRSGSWLQFRSALEDLGLDDRDGDDTNQRGLPTQHRFRLNLERLAHVEFEGSETENAWRVAPPVLAVTRLAGKSTGILCGARSTALLSRLREASGPAGWEEAQFPECPSVIRLFADDERSLARVAETAQVYFQPEATLNLLSLLHPVDRIALGTSADMPFGRDVNVEEFRVEKKRCHSVAETSVPRASIIWLAHAVKVVRPAARRLHRVRFARGWHLGITLGVCMSGFET